MAKSGLLLQLRPVEEGGIDGRRNPDCCTRVAVLRVGQAALAAGRRRQIIQGGVQLGIKEPRRR
eukprot:9480109-Lingulodinium_polyedra.AAC.1